MNEPGLTLDNLPKIQFSVWQNLCSQCEISQNQIKLTPHTQYSKMLAILLASILNKLVDNYLYSKIDYLFKQINSILSNPRDYSIKINLFFNQISPFIAKIHQNLQPIDANNINELHSETETLEYIKLHITKQKEFINRMLLNEIDLLSFSTRAFILLAYVFPEYSDFANQYLKQVFFEKQLIIESLIHGVQLQQKILLILQEYERVAISHIFQMPIEIYINQKHTPNQYLLNGNEEINIKKGKAIILIYQDRNKNDQYAKILNSFIPNPMTQYTPEDDFIQDFLGIIENIMQEMNSQFNYRAMDNLDFQSELYKTSNLSLMKPRWDPFKFSSKTIQSMKNLFQKLNFKNNLSAIASKLENDIMQYCKQFEINIAEKLAEINCKIQKIEKPLVIKQTSQIQKLELSIKKKSLMQKQNSEKENNSKFKNSLIQCPICYEEITDQKFIQTIHENHWICRNCLELWIKIKFNSRQWNLKYFTCPIQKSYSTDSNIQCQYKIESEIIQNILTNEEYNIIVQHSTQNEVVDINCPNCQKKIITIPQSQKNGFECPSCQIEICWICKKIAHQGNVCPLRLEQIGSVILDEKISCCPNCLEIYIKNEGCSHVSCINCEIEFCFYCSALRKPILNHGIESNYLLLNLNFK